MLSFLTGQGQRAIVHAFCQNDQGTQQEPRPGPESSFEVGKLNTMLSCPSSQRPGFRFWL
ncbi:rCG58250 [Rattus norvegicus]|uniref:RCG58250 n=1 Tax=Rattus norvegicus TaxID=10116 RepID=A6J5A6_RAT|nr:rCG58250 [Rattus norvegicus]